jgi:hypothetical protein
VEAGFFCSRGAPGNLFIGETLRLVSKGLDGGSASATPCGRTGTIFTATFTADNTGTQEFTYVGSSPNVLIPINGFELLEAVPEPSTVALFSVAVGLIGLVAVRRFRAVPVA